jgi:hypothetical protein
VTGGLFPGGFGLKPIGLKAIATTVGGDGGRVWNKVSGCGLILLIKIVQIEN